MLSQFQASYQRLEQSLQKLTDSIAAYNPSPSAADEVVAADEAVNADLEELIIHQTNHQRILHLREIAASLDETLKKTVRELADTRRKILEIPAATSNDNNNREDGDVRREVDIDETLSYAKFISRTTVPPSFRREDVPSLPSSLSHSTNVAGAKTNGKTSSPVKEELAGDSNDATKTITAKATDGQGNNEAEGVDNDDAAAKAYLDQELPFEPWPSQAHLQMGVLGDIQRIIESGRDPASVLTEEEQAAEEVRRKEAEERERLALEEAERRRMSMFDTGGSMGGTLRRRETAGDVFNPDDL